MDRLKEMLDFVNKEIELTKGFEYSEFYDGMIAGLQIVRGYLNSSIEMEGKLIAKERGEL